MYKYLSPAALFYQRFILRKLRVALILLSIPVTLWLTFSKNSLTSFFFYLPILLGLLTFIFESIRSKKSFYKSEVSWLDWFVIMVNNFFFCSCLIPTGNEDSPFIPVLFIILVIFTTEFNPPASFSTLLTVLCFIFSWSLFNHSVINWFKLLIITFSGITILFILFFIRKIQSHRDKKLLRLLTKDELTGLFNRSYLKCRMLDEIKRRRNFALIILDINFFKYYNDHWGHPQGDNLLIQIGKVLEKAVENYGIAVRFSGDEFIIFLPAVGENTVDYIIAEINQTIADQHFEGEECFPEHHLSLSLGSVLYPEQADSYETLISYADKSMYQNKHMRNQASISS